MKYGQNKLRIQLPSSIANKVKFVTINKRLFQVNKAKYRLKIKLILKTRKS